MPRGKGTVVALYCSDSNCPKTGTIYVTRIQKKNIKNIEKNKFCPGCNKHTLFKSKEVKKGGSKKYA